MPTKPVIPLAEAGRLLGAAMGLQSVPRSTLGDWVRLGVNGVVLDSVKVGHKRFTTADAVSKFLRELNPTRTDEG